MYSDNLLWNYSFDALYEANVYRIAPFKGLLVIKDINKKIIAEKEVGVSFDENFKKCGLIRPDYFDKEYWRKLASTIIKKHENNISE